MGKQWTFFFWIQFCRFLSAFCLLTNVHGHIYRTQWATANERLSVGIGFGLAERNEFVAEIVLIIDFNKLWNWMNNRQHIALISIKSASTECKRKIHFRLWPLTPPRQTVFWRSPSFIFVFLCHTQLLVVVAFVFILFNLYQQPTHSERYGIIHRGVVPYTCSSHTQHNVILFDMWINCVCGFYSIRFHFFRLLILCRRYRWITFL